MGTETYRYQIGLPIIHIRVKLNNPQMGTETHRRQVSRLLQTRPYR